MENHKNIYDACYDILYYSDLLTNQLPNIKTLPTLLLLDRHQPAYMKTKPVNILLIHPLGYSARNAKSDISRVANIMPPLGLASISAYLTSHGIANDIIDCYAHPDSDKLITQYLLVQKPDYVGFSCTTSSFFDGIRLAEIAKNLLPEVVIVFGGVHVSAVKEDILKKYPVIDYCVVGEGEETLRELLCSKSTSQKTNIPGLVLREKNGDIRFVGQRKEQLDLDSLPFPDYKKLDGYPQAYKLPIFNYPKVPNASCISSKRLTICLQLL